MKAGDTSFSLWLVFGYVYLNHELAVCLWLAKFITESAVAGAIAYFISFARAFCTVQLLAFTTALSLTRLVGCSLTAIKMAISLLRDHNYILQSSKYNTSSVEDCTKMYRFARHISTIFWGQRPLY